MGWIYSSNKENFLKIRHLDCRQRDERTLLKHIIVKHVIIACLLSIPSISRVVGLSYSFVHPCSVHCNPETHFRGLISLVATVMFTASYYFLTYLVTISGGHKDKFAPQRGAVLSWHTTV
jgi:hypothetical protein